MDELCLRDAHVLLTDFGEAYRPLEEQRFDCRTPAHFRPPESFFRPSQPRSFPSDIWTLACSIWAIFGDFPLFNNEFLPCSDYIINRQVQLLGKLPSDWWAQWEARSSFFTEDVKSTEWMLPVFDWEFNYQQSIQARRRRYRMDLVSMEEKDALLAMLKPMLMYKPEDRVSVGDVLKSRWMADWGMPAYLKLRDREYDLSR